MSNQIIKCDTAKVAKDKGFDLEVDNFYENTGPMSGNILHDGYAEENYNDFDFKFHDDSICFSAPTQTTLQTWLREVKKVRVYVTNSAAGEFKYEINIVNPIQEDRIGKPWERKYNYTSYRTYEEALETGLLESLKLAQ